MVSGLAIGGDDLDDLVRVIDRCNSNKCALILSFAQSEWEVEHAPEIFTPFIGPWFAIVIGDGRKSLRRRLRDEEGRCCR